MAITINGSGTITGVSAGGLPDGSVTADDLASTLDLGSKTLTIPTDTTGLPSGGLEEADTWRISSNYTLTTQYNYERIPSNWERDDDSSFEKIGTGLTESSGVFAFPSTGKYLIIFNGEGDGGSTSVTFYSRISTDGGSNYDVRASTRAAGTTSGSDSRTYSFMVDVTDTANVRMDFTAYTSASSGVTVSGNSYQTSTGFTCIKLGET